MYNNPLYFINLDDPADRLKFQFVPYEMNANDVSYNAIIKSPGRNAPHVHYTGAEDNLEFTMDYYADDSDLESVIKRCKQLKSWSRNDAYDKPPPRIRLVWGPDMWVDSEWQVIKAPYKMTQFNRPSGMRPVQAYQEITLIKIVDYNETRIQTATPFS